MVTGIDLNATKEFVSPRDKNNPTVWIISALGSDKTGKITLGGGPSFDLVIAMTQEGIRGWRNFKNAKGEDIPFDKKSTLVPLDIIRQIPPVVLVEISGEILKLSKVSDKEIKN